MNNWQEKPEVKKGNIGERIVNELLSKDNYIIYRPITNGSHKIDFFAHKQDSDKNIICVEAKSKKRMACYIETGFNYSNYLHYIEIQEKYGIDTYVYFIDDFEECIYGSWLKDLGEGNKMGEVITWPLQKMQFHRWLNENELIELKEYTKENYDYSKVKKYFKDKQLDLPLK